MTRDDELLEAELFPEEELERALAPVRPDPDAFEAGVREKIEAAERRVAKTPRWLKFAAGVLPPGALESQAVLAAGTKGSLKAVAPVIVAAPILALAMLAVAFVGAFRALAPALGPRGAVRADGTERQRFEIALAGWRTELVVCLLALVGVGVVFYWRGLVAVLLVLIVSMIGFVVLLRRMSDAGYADRLNVGGRAFAFLLTLGLVALQLDQFMDAGGMTSLLLLGGAVTCLAISGVVQARWRSTRKRSVFGLVGLVPAIMLAIAQAWPFPEPDVDEQRSYLESFDRTDNSAYWRDYAIVARRLRERGGTFDASAVGAAARGSDNGYILVAALDAGVVQPAELGASSFHAREREWTLEQEGRIHFFLQKVPFLLHLAATETLSAEERAHVAARVDASWPEGGTDVLREVRMAVAVFDALGAADRVEARVPDVHALLERLQGDAGGRRGRTGGFRGYEDGRLVNFDATDDAILLMARVGVPAGVDLVALDQVLAAEAGKHWMFGGLLDHAFVAAATHGTLQDVIGVPRPSFARTLIEQRLFLAAVLLVVLCIWATRRAPVVRSAEV